MAKKITLKDKEGNVLCPHTAIEQVQGLKEALESGGNIEIDTRNLIPNSTKIGRVSSSSDNYSFVTITLPTDVGVKIGDVFTFNCDKVENVQGNPTKYSIRLYNKKTGTVASKEQQITAENRVLPLEAWIDVEQGELALLVYMGAAGATAGNEVYFHNCTLVKGDKPMLLWQAAPEDIQEQLDTKLSLSGGTLTGDLTAPTYKGTTDKSGVYSEAIMSYPSSFASEDLNSERFLKAGMYRLDGVNDTINQPGGRGYGHLMTIRSENSDTAAQMFFDYFDNGNAYIRTGSTNPNAGDFYILNRAWKQLLEDLVTTSHIADTSITSEKLAQSLILRGTPQLETQPSLSSESQNIASVGFVKNYPIDTRNLLSNSKEITIDGSTLTSGTKYITKRLPISVAVGDVLTFSCEDLVINAGTDETHAILLYSGEALAAAKYISPTSKTATITVTKASTTPYLYMYAGFSNDSAGKSITYKGATLVKGDKPMLLWQRAEEDLDDVADYTVFPNLISASDLELGGLTDANGSNSTTTSATRARSAGYIPVSAPKITLKSWTDGVVFYLWTYKADKTPIQMSFSSTNWVSAKYTYTLPAGTAYIRLCIKKTSGAEFTLSELKTLKLKAENGSKATDWQPSAADMQVSRPTVYYQSNQPSILTAHEGDIWIVS